MRVDELISELQKYGDSDIDVVLVSVDRQSCEPCLDVAKGYNGDTVVGLYPRKIEG
jgi:hypothetical protein